jgi:hypothetical protein
MAFELTPATGQPIRPPEPVDVAVLDFIVDPAVWSVTRGVGENSHIVTLKITGGVTQAVTWDPVTASSAALIAPNVWVFADSNYDAYIYYIPS